MQKALFAIIYLTLGMGSTLCFAAGKKAPCSTAKLMFPKNFVIKHRLSNCSNLTTPLSVAAGGAFSFNQTPVVYGKAIKQINGSTFQITQHGDYLIQFTTTLNFGKLVCNPTAQVRVNGNLVGVENNLFEIPTFTAIVHIKEATRKKPALLQIIATTPVALDSVSGATQINIAKLFE